MAKFSAYAIVFGLFCLILFANCSKQPEPAPHCGLNNLEYINGKCDCPTNKYRMNNVCLTPDTGLWYGTGHNHGYFDTVALQFFYTPNWTCTENFTLTASDDNRAISGCGIFHTPDGDSISRFSLFDYFYIDTARCYLFVGGKFSKDREQVKLTFVWLKPLSGFRELRYWPAIDTTYMVLKNHL